MKSRHHRSIVALVLAVAVAAPAAAQGRVPAAQRQRQQAAERQRQAAERQREIQARWPEVTEAFTSRTPLGRNGTLDLENVAGNIVITGGRGDDVRIEAVKRVRHPMEAQARTLLRAVQVNVVPRGGNVEVRTTVPRGPSMFGVVDYTIAVPSAANVTIRTMSGNVRITNVNGELRAEAVSGDVQATGVRRVRVVKTMTGDIEVTDGESEELTASTMSGNLTVNNLKGRFFDLQSVTGTLRLMNVEPERVNLRSMNGNIEYVGRFMRSGRYDFSSHAGHIHLTPTTNQGFDVEAGTFDGSFRSDFELRIVEDSGRAGRPRIGRVVRGVFGDAGAAITAHTMNGDIVIVKR